jgi:hypothetical protein
MLHQKINAMLFQRDWEGIALRDSLDDLYVGNIEFVAAGGPLVSADFAFHDDTRLLRETLHRVENVGWNGTLRYNALNHTGAIAKLRKEKLPALAKIVEPAANGDGLTFVFANFSDRGYKG